MAAIVLGLTLASGIHQGALRIKMSNNPEVNNTSVTEKRRPIPAKLLHLFGKS